MPKILNSLDMQKNELQNGVIHPLASAPSSPKEGQVYYNTTEDNIYRYTGTQWVAYSPALIPFGTVDSTSTSTVFTATVPGITELKDGVCMLLRNSVVTSATNFTININGLGAKPSYNNMTTGNPHTPTDPVRDTTIFNINYTMLFIYSTTIVSGGCWICYRGYDANSNTIGYQLRTNSFSLPMKQITYRYRLFFMSADNLGWVPANTSTSTNATALREVNQAKINPFGPIVYYGTTTSVAAGSRPGVAYLWQQYAFTLGYSFNRTGAALTLTPWKPVYIKCAPQTDGSAIIDADNPYVQDLPTSADGKIYIYLGVAYAATTVELTYNHPVYEYKDGAIREYTNGKVSWNDLLDKPTLPDVNTFVVTFTHDGTNAPTCDKTTTQIAEANESGKAILVKYINTTDSREAIGTFNIISTEYSNSTYYFNYAVAYVTLPSGRVKEIEWAYHGTAWTVTDYQEDYLPTQTNNSGKFLTTDGTSASWETIPSDSNKQDKITASGILKGNGSGTVSAAVAGTDYQAPITFDGTYNASSNKAATVSTVTNAINALDGGTIGSGSTTKTITSLSQTNGNVSATFSDIAFPVTSVNTKTGAVSLTASDVDAAPVLHTSSTDLYGKGTDSVYGHVLLSDSTSSSTAAATGGTAATPKAVKAAYDLANTANTTAGGKQDKITAAGILKGNGSGTITAAVAGTDYQAPITFDGTYNASSNKAATVSTVTNAINTLDGGTIGSGGAGKTITALSQTNGNVSATFGNISITTSQVSDFPSTMPPTSHADGNTTYGKGTDSLYGHLKLSDSTTSTSSTSGGTAATPAAVKAVKDLIPNVPSWALASSKPTYTASEVGAVATTAVGAASGVAPLNASSKIEAAYLPSYVDDVIEGYYNSTDGKFYEEGTYTTEIPAEAGKIYIDLATDKSYRWGGSVYVQMPTGSTVTVSQGLSSGTTVGTITIDGTTTTLYAPTDTDTMVTQTKATYSSYTYWRPLINGSSSNSSVTGAFSTVTNTSYTFDNLRYQPSTGTIRTHIYNVAPTAAGTTASNNQMASDSTNNIYFRVNNGTDTVMTLYSNGTEMQVRPGGQYDDAVDLGKSTVRWKDLYLSGTANVGNIALPSTGGTITNLSTPTNDTDAANKEYVDSAISGIQFPANCEVTVTHVAGTWAVDTTYSTMTNAHDLGLVVYFTYGIYTAIASFKNSNVVTANIMYMDSDGIHQKQISVNSSDEVSCTETDCPIYNGQTL